MGWLSKLGDAIRSYRLAKKSFLMGDITSFWDSESVSPVNLIKQAKGWVYGCVNKIANEVSAVNLRLYRKNGTERGKWEEVETHDILTMFDDPWEGLTRSELFWKWSAHDDLTGNAFWFLEGVKNENDKPTGLCPLDPARVTIKIGGTPEKLINYRYQTGSGREVTYQPFEVIHFRSPSPRSNFEGMGPTEAAADAIDTENYSREWNRRFFRNAGRPGLILESDRTDPTAINLIRQSFDDKFGGVSKAHKTAILPQGVKVAKEGYNQKDMDFIEQRRFSRDEILAQFGVPAVILGLGLGETINRASADTLRYIFALYTIKPKLTRFVTFLNKYLVSRYGDDLVLEFDDPVPENIEMKIREDESALGRSPWKSVNEIRLEHGLVSISGGDAVMGSALLTPLGSPEKAATTPARKTIAPIRSRKGDRDAKKKTLSHDLAVAAVETIKKVRKEATANLMTEDWEPRWEAMVKRAGAYETEIRRIMAVYAQGMTERALAGLPNEAKAQIDALELLDREYEVAAVIAGLKPEFLKILELEGIKAAEMIGAAFDATDERIQESLAKSLMLLAQKYNEETVSLLRQSIQDAYDEDDASLPALKKRIKEIGEFSESSRAMAVAKTESFRMSNFSAREAWRQSGVVKSLKWYTARDELVCPECAPLDGTTVGIDESFLEKGDTTATGREIVYADVEGGALHPNCRCYIRPADIET